MTTATQNPQTTEECRSQAAEQVKQLESELGQLPRRRQEAAATVETLNARIAQQERSGDAEALAELRAERRDAAEALQDLTRTIATVERELEGARAYYRAAAIACHAEKYNAIVEKQRALTSMISEAVETIVASVQLKQELATMQDAIHGDVGQPYPNLSPLGMRWDILQEITKRLQLAGAPTPIRAIDWSGRRMSSHGVLEALS